MAPKQDLPVVGKITLYPANPAGIVAQVHVIGLGVYNVIKIENRIVLRTRYDLSHKIPAHLLTLTDQTSILEAVRKELTARGKDQPEPLKVPVWARRTE